MEPYPPFYNKKELENVLFERKEKIQNIFSNICNIPIVKQLLDNLSFGHVKFIFTLKITKTLNNDICETRQGRNDVPYVYEESILITERTILENTYDHLREMILHNLLHLVLGTYKHHHDLVWQYFIKECDGDPDIRCISINRRYQYKNYKFLYCCSNKKCEKSNSNPTTTVGKIKNCKHCNSPYIYIRSSPNDNM